MTIEERVERLEKRTARWRALTVILGICLVLVTAVAASPVVDQSRIILRDKQGKGRIVLWVQPNGDSRISFYNRKSLETMRIGAYDEGKPYISTWSTSFPRKEYIVRFSPRHVPKKR